MINMVMLRQWDPTIDPREEWQEYVLAVQKDSKLVKEYPDLVYDEASWEVDLRAHIIVRRRKWWSGVESRERAEAKVYNDNSVSRITANCVSKEAKKKTKLEAVAANRKRQIKATRKGLGQKKTQAGNLRSQGKWDLQMSKEVRK
jgi:hypothetical protein